MVSQMEYDKNSAIELKAILVCALNKKESFVVSVQYSNENWVNLVGLEKALEVLSRCHSRIEKVTICGMNLHDMIKQMVDLTDPILWTGVLWFEKCHFGIALDNFQVLFSDPSKGL